MLYAIEIPQDAQGHVLGSTMFASTTDAYEALPEKAKSELEGLIAENTMRYSRKVMEAQGLGKKRTPLTEVQERLMGAHPVVRTHPETGRKCLYVSSTHTERIRGMSDEVSRKLVDELQELIVQPERVYRHEWAVGDLLMWDNCATQHCAVKDYGDDQHRLMYRVSVMGLPTH